MSVKAKVDEGGFTMVEMIIAVVILAGAILALSTSTTQLTSAAIEAEKKALALQAAEDRLTEVRMHPLYTQLDSVFTESDSDIPGLDTFSRSTAVTRTVSLVESTGKYLDYTTVTVTVDGPGLGTPIERTVTVGGS